jgi:Ca2+ transporting ATPase
MYKENNLVRFLQACETMGGVDTVCSDKTGTLTTNIMTVTNLFTEETKHTKIDKANIQPKTLELIGEGICVNSNAFPKIDSYGKFE